MNLTDLYTDNSSIDQLATRLAQRSVRLHLDGLTGSMPALIMATLAQRQPTVSLLAVAPSREEAFYLANDIEALVAGRRVLLFPYSYRSHKHQQRQEDYTDEVDNANVLQRSEVLKELSAGVPLGVVSYPEALAEKVVGSRLLLQNTLRIAREQQADMWDVVEELQEKGFERVDFVVQAGQYAVRGGIIDVFSYANELPYRIEFSGETVSSLRTFDAATQLSVKQLDRVDIVPNLDLEAAGNSQQAKVSLLEYFTTDDSLWCQSLLMLCEKVEDTEDFLRQVLKMKVVEYGNSHYFRDEERVEFHSEPQPVMGKQFDLLKQNLLDYAERSYRLCITVSNESQRRRLEKLLGNDLSAITEQLSILELNLAHGFIDHDSHLLCYTDHEIFERYHKYSVRNLSAGHEALTLKELFELKPGDFVTHIDYGVGRFSGLEKVTQNGRSQELIRLIYKNNDVLYISIHGLHKISRYVGREGEAPQLNRLGSNTWQVLKQRTKKQVKNIARDLIALYAKRKASQGFAFSADSELQEQLEASFLYEDTPDQLKATIAVKHDMEEGAPMDRLVCGDVGFGKTEVAIRAAFKACCDSKQVAVLVPSTVLAFQHYNTFCERLKELPVRIDYLNRFRTAKEKTQIYKDVASGKIDILIGTHAITNKELKFKDLGLLIIDEEQKFGVSVKEKLKQMKVGVDCLTLTATPIPRTLQFSLMGARDLSIIQTPPPNRQPIETELSDFNEELIRDAISFELSREGQVFFISNRVENLPEMAGLVQRLVPDARVAIAHGRMEGKQAEEVLMRFLEGEVDVLVATSIAENGLDIPNANTMIINNAHQFGLSDLHQMRGRVGRSGRKAFCYLLIPSYLTLTDEAQRRLHAIEEFSSIGSGFNIAMRDLDIRGAGNILGAEQSGFISEVGYDMYHKILNEALNELRWEEAADPSIPSSDGQGEAAPSISMPQNEISFVSDCVLETDLEVLLPDDYVTSGSERLLLYRELSDLQTDDDLAAYRNRLQDRFGPVPACADELILSVSLRRVGREFGIEKIILKQGRMVLHLPSNQQSPFYSSSHFARLIHFVQANPASAHLKETPNRLSLSIDGIDSVSAAIERLAELTEKSPQ